MFSFGNKITDTFDIIFYGALIHWIFSLTAEFRSFDKILEYLIPIANKFIVIVWISENDGSLKSFNHIKKRKLDTDEEYNTLY